MESETTDFVLKSAAGGGGVGGHLGYNHGAARGATGGEGVKPGERGVSRSPKTVGKEVHLIPREETRRPR